MSNYMTAERMLALATAGYNIRQFYLKVEAEIIVFRSNATDGMVSLDTFQEIINRCRPRQADIDLVGFEKKHFEENQIRRAKSRDYRRNQRQFQREENYENRAFASDERAIIFDDEPPNTHLFSSTRSGANRPAQTDNRELHELHAELAAAFGKGVVVNTDQIRDTIKIEQPTIDALVNNEYLRRTSPKTPDRYFIENM